MIDQNRDGFIDSEDLKDMLASLGEARSTQAQANCSAPNLMFSCHV